MTQEKKDLLIKDLSARFKYQTKGLHRGQVRTIIALGLGGCYQVDDYDCWFNLDNTPFKPYLRPMSSMTEEEYKELKEIEPYYGIAPFNLIDDWAPNYEVIDWLNAHHFDYRGLISKNLALEAPEGMYN